MTYFLVQLAAMSLQGVFMVCVVLVLRKICGVLHTAKRQAAALWLIPYFFLVFPWKIQVPGGFWDGAPVWAALESYIGQDGALGKSGQDASGTTRIPSASNGQEGGLEEVFNSGGFSSSLPGGFFTQGNDAGRKSGSGKQNAFGQAQAGSQQAGRFEGIWTVAKAAPFLLAVWAAGALFFIFRGAAAYWRLKRFVRYHSIPAGQDTACYVDSLPVPMAFGYIHPRIYLPSGLEQAYEPYVSAHEYTHIKRNDAVWKTAAYVVSSIHWFNPAVWLAYAVLSTDLELACDEETLLRIGLDKKKEYATALLHLAAGKEGLFAAPPAFGKGDIKLRMKHIMHCRKPVRFATVLSAAAGIFTACVFLTAAEPKPGHTAQGEIMPKDNTSSNAAKMETGQHTLTLEMFQEAVAAQAVGQMDFHRFTNGSKGSYDAYAMNYALNFDLEYKDEAYRLSVSYEKSTDQLQDIYIRRLSDAEQAWLYTTQLDYLEGKDLPAKKDGRGGAYLHGLQAFLDTKRNVGDWLSVKLKKGYTLGSYQADLGEGGGALIYPKAYEVKAGGDFVPKNWMYSGFIGRFPGAGNVFPFHNGKIGRSVETDHSFWSIWMPNHTTVEDAHILEDGTADKGWTVIMAHFDHDLYTAADLAELEMQGVPVDSLETTSGYWYFYFVKEGEEDAYYISLSDKEFSKKEAIATVRSVKMV